MKIEDGKGRSGDMSVSASQRGNVSAKTAPRAFYISRDDGLAFSAVMHDASSVAGDYVFYIKNTSSTRNLIIDSLEPHAVEAVLWKVWAVTGTAAGATAIIPSILNLSKSLPSEATSMGGAATITGLTLGNELATHRTEATSGEKVGFKQALILGPENAIMLEYDTGVTGISETNCVFHYETIGAT